MVVVPNEKEIYFGYKLYLDCDLGWGDDVGVNALGASGLGLHTKSNIIIRVAQRFAHHSDLSENGQNGKKTSV